MSEEEEEFQEAIVTKKGCALLFDRAPGFTRMALRWQEHGYLPQFDSLIYDPFLSVRKKK